MQTQEAKERRKHINFDDEFEMPKADIYLNIKLNDMNWTKDIRANTLAGIWVRLFNKNF